MAETQKNISADRWFRNMFLLKYICNLWNVWRSHKWEIDFISLTKQGDERRSVQLDIYLYIYIHSYACICVDMRMIKSGLSICVYNYVCMWICLLVNVVVLSISKCRISLHKEPVRNKLIQWESDNIKTVAFVMMRHYIFGWNIFRILIIHSFIFHCTDYQCVADGYRSHRWLRELSL